MHEKKTERGGREHNQIIGGGQLGEFSILIWGKSIVVITGVTKRVKGFQLGRSRRGKGNFSTFYRPNLSERGGGNRRETAT